MNLLPRSIRNMLARTKPAAPKLCTLGNIAQLYPVPNWSRCNWPNCPCPDGTMRDDCTALLRNTPETQRETWINDHLPLDVRARRAEGDAQ